eukprot:NODE_20_length_39102_cov_0.325513.p13 type:complete len:283 gc:universal NODE_20_length_39102_cov_0.325513:611-1459(+)
MQHLEYTPDDLDIFNGELVYACYELKGEKRIGKVASINSGTLYRGCGILDIEVSNNILYGAASDGSLISISRVNNKIESLKLENGLNLTMDINSNDDCCISNNHGNIFIVDLNCYKIAESFNGHLFEVWSCCWNDEKSFFTGADDCTIKFWDLKDLSSCQWQKRMDMGISCIAKMENKTLIGNYDEKLRTIDPRMPDIFLQELDCGGGIWRMKQNPCDPNIWLIAAMHGGSHIVDIAKNEILQSFTSHKSMVYGAIWLDEIEVATCSFYDKNLSFWSWEKKQ